MSRPSRTPRSNAEAAVLALGNAICGPGGSVETVRPRPRKDTPAARYRRLNALLAEIALLCTSTPSASWSAFLDIRLALIRDLRREGQSPAEIASVISADATQVARIIQAHKAAWAVKASKR